MSLLLSPIKDLMVQNFKEKKKKRIKGEFKTKEQKKT